ncbi:MAG: UDP-3-O-[3-hydroxymyristoyl] N-acetylglucosamine deacetylase [Kiritimatiellia bacterium]|jgi:UDP-3-O-[3-hydroxymyristoyl] N-acetylglucosamine deacetylase
MRLQTASQHRTLATAFERSGFGVHTAHPVRVRVGPAHWGAGIVFEIDGQTVPATLHTASAPGGCTVLSRGDHRVMTPEHLMAALSLAGITDATVQLSSPELPILDGAAQSWWDGLMHAGTVDGPERQPVRVLHPGEFVGQGGRAAWWPSDSQSIEVKVAYNGTIARARHKLGAPVSPSLLQAKTFCLASQVHALRSAGRGRGANEHNTIVVSSATPEVAHHKLLDAIGDAALMGPFTGHLLFELGSHALHQAALRSLLDKSAVD